MMTLTFQVFWKKLSSINMSEKINTPTPGDDAFRALLAQQKPIFERNDSNYLVFSVLL